MFHLYDKVYLDFDQNLSAYEPRVVISDRYGADDQTGGFATQYAFGKVVSDVIGEDKDFVNELDFFKQIKTLAAGNRFVVYCDKTALQHLFIAWHKILLNITDSANVWNVWKLFVDKESYRSTVTEAIEHVQYNDIKISNWNQQEFVDKFNSISVTKDSIWLQSILNDLGIEYLLASYVNGSAQTKSAFERKLKLLASRTLQAELYDTKLNVIANAYNKTLHTTLSIDCPSSVADLLSNDSLSILNDPDIWTEENQMTPSDNHGSVDIAALTGEKLSAVITAFKLVRENFQKLQSESPYVKKIEWLNWVNNASITDAELADILQSDEFCSCELVTDTDHDKVNILLVDWVIMLYKSSSLNSISDLTISV
jgi:hypothetical protein